MAFLFMSIETAAQVAQSVFIKIFGKRCRGGDIFFTAMMSFTAMLFFALTSIGTAYTLEVIPYSFGFSVCYAFGTLMYILALGCGSMGITALLISYSLAVPTLYGLVFWNETLSAIQAIGIAILLVSLFLVREKREPEKKKLSFKWAIYMTIAFVGNGLCSIIQREQQLRFGEKYDSCFMVIALTMAVIILFAAALILERKQILTTLKKGAFLSAACGISNGIANLFIMLSLVFIPASIFFPIIAAAQTIVTFIISMLLFGERFIPRQWVGIVLGTAALVLMNI